MILQPFAFLLLHQQRHVARSPTSRPAKYNFDPNPYAAAERAPRSSETCRSSAVWTDPEDDSGEDSEGRGVGGGGSGGGGGGMPNWPPMGAPSVSASPGWSSDPQTSQSAPAGSASNSGAASALTAAGTTAPGAVALRLGPLRLRWPLQAGCEGQRPTRPRRVGGVGSGLACSALVSYPRLCLSQ